jgi:hypothetical protein
VYSDENCHSFCFKPSIFIFYLLLTSDQAGKFIKFEVTPVALTGELVTGTAAISNAILVVPAEEPAKDDPDISKASEIKIIDPSELSSPVPDIAAQVEYEKTIPGFVTMSYNVILGRDPDTEGYNGWVAGLTDDSISGDDLVNGFLFSEGDKTTTSGDTNEQFLTSLYKSFFLIPHCFNQR